MQEPRDSRPPDIRHEIQAVVEAACRILGDDQVAGEVLSLRFKGKPLPPDEARQLLKTVVEVMRRCAEAEGDEATSKALEGNVDDIVDRIMGGEDDPEEDQRPLCDHDCLC